MANKGGRPKKEIDWNEFDKLCFIQCTLREIAHWFDCSEDTIERAVKREHDLAFAEYYRIKADKGIISLRRVGFQKAMEGIPAYWIFHAKNYLGMSDKQEFVVQNKPNDTQTDSVISEALGLLKNRS